MCSNRPEDIWAEAPTNKAAAEVGRGPSFWRGQVDSSNGGDRLKKCYHSKPSMDHSEP